ncbi:SDR family NAD(P)-dependent oxidoreductase [Meridianimarinicoccus sp. RP-17]|uniref:SDR family NAD(P)-dependent oxidoreductase n=1 Tax=Meridianimarinicoccus zhengii TaxID=2056810 RepID=UPI000DAE1E21|nr:SDR family NAD(P)-dependent oxidoreductase [Phycocomes zhengii]
MKREWIGKRYWLVGASEGLGRALAHRMSAAGAELILSARDRGSLDALAAELPGRCHVLPMDATDPEAVATAEAQLGRVDGLVYLAGVYWPMKATDWDSDRAAQMITVNVNGAIRSVGAVLPQMLARGGGHIVLTGSLSAYRGLPGTIGYSASKAAIMSLAESMQCDLHNSGIDVQLANPGFIRTRLTDKNDFRMPFLMEPDAAARAMLKHMESDRFAVDFPWLFSTVFRLSRLLPEFLYTRIFGARA